MAAAPSHFNALGRALVQGGKLVQADATAIQMEAGKAGFFIQQLVTLTPARRLPVAANAAATLYSTSARRPRALPST
jgi:hypothetical protein